MLTINKLHWTLIKHYSDRKALNSRQSLKYIYICNADICFFGYCACYWLVKAVTKTTILEYIFSANTEISLRYNYFQYKI